MTSTTTELTRPALRKLEPTVKMPTAATLSALSEFDVRLLRQRLAEVAECVYDEVFARDDAVALLMGPMPAANVAGEGSATSCDDSGVHSLRLVAGQALTTEQEQFLFRRFNYCRYRVMEILRAYAGKRLNLKGARDLLHWEHQTRDLRGEIVRINMPLVLAMAKRTRITAVDHAELVSEGNMALLRAVEKFDCNRGFKFSTYACRAILKSFSRVASRTARYRGYFPVEFDPTLERSDYIESKRNGLESDCVDELKSILGRNLAKLSETEERVIRARFALDVQPRMFDNGPTKGKTLEQVGEIIGVTKERVRQIQNKALVKLRAVLERDMLAG